MLRITALLVVVAIAATAQMPVPLPFGECGFEDDVHGTGKAGVLEPNQFAIPRGDLCEMYTFEVGWEETMVLQLGDGADDYRDLIEQAVKVWNQAAYVPSGNPLIEISDERPSNYLLSRSFWERLESFSSQNLEDSENVIYFKSDDSEHGPRGYAKLEATTFGNRILEADVYINTDHEEEYGLDYGPSLGVTEMVAPYWDDEHGAYSIINATYIVILHEIGHAIGLKHIPVQGNVMGKGFTVGTIDQWQPTFTIHFINELHRWGHTILENPSQMPYVFGHDDLSPYMVIPINLRGVMDTFTDAARLGAQEKMMLACIYQY